MATSLHQQLKHHYVVSEQRHEVELDGYRIDAVDRQQRLIEIQCASLGAIRDKVRRLLVNHQVIVVKPLASRKQIVRMDEVDGDILSCRFSPSRETLATVFLDLVHFSTVFPHPRLRLDVLLTHQKEVRLPPSRRSSWKRKYRVHDRELLSVEQHYRFSTPADLWRELDADVSDAFTTADLAAAIQKPRWLAQKIAYCFRQMGFIELAGKQGNSLMYQLTKKRGRKKRRTSRPDRSCA